MLVSSLYFALLLILHHGISHIISGEDTIIKCFCGGVNKIFYAFPSASQSLWSETLLCSLREMHMGLILDLEHLQLMPNPGRCSRHPLLRDLAEYVLSSFSVFCFSFSALFLYWPQYHLFPAASEKVKLFGLCPPLTLGPCYCNLWCEFLFLPRSE